MRFLAFLFLTLFLSCSGQESLINLNHLTSNTPSIERNLPNALSGESAVINFRFLNLEIGEGVEIFTDAACALPSIIQHTVTSSNDSVPYTLSNYGQFHFYAKSTQAVCEPLQAYQYLPPRITSINLLSPTSPGESSVAHFEVGTVVAGASVEFFSNNTCTASLLGENEQNSSSLYRISNFNTGVNRVWARQTVGGVSSACSLVSVEYQYSLGCTSAHQSGDASFPRGAGSESDPYYICNALQFNNLSTALDKHFRIGVDIDFSSVAPVSVASCFSGSIDGQNHKLMNMTHTAPIFNCYRGKLENLVIENLSITATVPAAFMNEAGNSGDSPVFKNIRLKNINVTSTARSSGFALSSNGAQFLDFEVQGTIIGTGGGSGGIVGAAVNSTINNAQVSVDISNGSRTGGVAGSIEGSFVTNVQVAGSLKGDGQVGGVIGYSDNSTIYKVSISATVEGDWSNGGVIGYLDTSKLSNCYSLGIVKAGYQSGAAVGVIKDGELANCYVNAATIQTNDSNFPRGFLGAQSGAGSIIKSNYYNSEQTIVQPSAGLGVGVVEAIAANSFNNPANFIGWNFGLVWNIQNGFPVFQTSRVPNTFYFAPTGLESNSGLAANSPWKNSSLLGYEAIPGDTFIFASGTYSEPLEIYNSGTTHNPIRFIAGVGETPLLHPTLTGISGVGVVKLSNVSNIEVKGFKITAAEETTTDRTPIGVYVEGAGENIILSDLEVYEIKNTHASGDAHGILVRGNQIKPISNIKVLNSIIRDSILGSSEALALNGNVTDFVISGNNIFNNNNIGIDIIGYEGTCSQCSPELDRARSGVIADNKVHGNSSLGNPAYGAGDRAAVGIYVDGGKGITIERNEVFDNDFGIELASEKVGSFYADNIIVRSNVIYENFNSGIAIGGYSATRNGCRNCDIVHNTFYNNDADDWYGEIYFQHNNHNVSLLNNIFFSVSGQVMQAVSVAGTELDNNLYHHSSAVNFRVGGSSYTMASFQSTFSMEDKGVVGNPLFVDAGNADFTLQAISPAKDQAVSLLAEILGTFDYLGNSRVQGITDIGAIEIP